MNDQEIWQKAMKEYTDWVDSKDPTSMPLVGFVQYIVKKTIERKNEDRKALLDIVGKEEMVITMKIRDADDQVEAIRHIFTFDMIRQSGRKLYQHAFEAMLANMMTAPIMSKLLVGED